MPDVEIITDEKYYAIKDDLTFSSHSNLTEASLQPNLKFLLKRIIGHNPFTTNNNGVIKNYASTMNLCDSNGDAVERIIEKDWRMKLKSFGFTYGYSYNTMWVGYTDTFGFEADETFGISVEEFIKAYQRFSKLNEYQGYQLATVSIENEGLKQKNMTLKDKVSDLTREVEQLRFRLSQMG